MATPLLVTGATGRLGRLVVAGLLERARAVRVLTRRPQDATALFGSRVEVAEGRFEDAASLQGALRGVERVFLLSPIGSTLAEQQVALIQAARAAGVRRIVKLSGSDWTIAPPGRSISGDAHRAVEEALARSGIEHAVLRPNAWMQVALGRLGDELHEGDVIRSAIGNARVSYIDVRDIAEVAVQVLLADTVPNEPLVLTGARALSHSQIAELAALASGRPIRAQALSEAEQTRLAQRHGLPDVVRKAHGQFAELIRAGAAAGVTDTVARMLDRAPRSIDSFIAEQLRA